MKYLKLWEQANKNIKKGDFYSKFWITELSKELGETTIDKYKPIKRLYGGGDISQISYTIEVEDNEDISKIILEGITDNGEFIQASVIFIRDKPIYHGSLDTHLHIDKELGFRKNIPNIISEIKAKMKEYKES